MIETTDFLWPFAAQLTCPRGRRQCCELAEEGAVLNRVLRCCAPSPLFCLPSGPELCFLHTPFLSLTPFTIFLSRDLSWALGPYKTRFLMTSEAKVQSTCL